jgi:hypothetical protein
MPWARYRLPTVVSAPDPEHPDIEQARADPRLRRGRGAPLGDFFQAVTEAERSRRLAMWGLHELGGAFDPSVAPADPAGQAARHRAALAHAELVNEYPFLNAMTLVALYSALDALVEDLAPEVFKLRLRLQGSDLVRKAADQHSAEWAQLTEDQRNALEEAVFLAMEQHVAQPKFGRVRGEGGGRYEAVLATVGLGAPADRPIPQDMDDALTELSAIRDVMVHRGGRVDGRALKAAPTLTLVEGELIRLRRADYLRYAAALRTYGMEIGRRLLGSSVFDVDLAQWRLNQIVND